ncbi:MAG: hypothetical protein L0Y35_05885 [Flammeovirgaceae bacterium]|nr:hypothetical protein [Flammeovirgaceae bacterium]
MRLSRNASVKLSKKVLLIFIFLCSACGGTLSDEQRKKLIEGQKSQEIKKVTEGELTQLAMTRGGELATLAAATSKNQIDSLSQAVETKIQWLEPGRANSYELESQLIEAYIMGLATGVSLQDNVQKKGTDSLLFTRAVVEKRPDGIDELKGLWCITLSKKQLVLSME